nr:hypothetical protein [uncultured Cohaesibacter sp.]
MRAFLRDHKDLCPLFIEQNVTRSTVWRKMCDGQRLQSAIAGIKREFSQQIIPACGAIEMCAIRDETNASWKPTATRLTTVLAQSILVKVDHEAVFSSPLRREEIYALG